MTYLGNTVSYEYDANGIRTKKINPTGMSTDYYVVDGKAIGEVVKYADGTIAYWLRYLFDESGQIIGYSFWCVGDTAWSEYYFAKNLQGDVIGVYRASDNAQVAFYEYDAWGNILYKYGEMADINPFRYRTYYYDNETGSIISRADIMILRLDGGLALNLMCIQEPLTVELDYLETMYMHTVPTIL